MCAVTLMWVGMCCHPYLPMYGTKTGINALRGMCHHQDNILCMLVWLQSDRLITGVCHCINGLLGQSV